MKKYEELTKEHLTDIINSVKFTDHPSTFKSKYRFKNKVIVTLTVKSNQDLYLSGLNVNRFKIIQKRLGIAGAFARNAKSYIEYDYNLTTKELLGYKEKMYYNGKLHNSCGIANTSNYKYLTIKRCFLLDCYFHKNRFKSIVL